MAKLPFLALYPSDYLADTGHLTLAEHGAYLLLLFAYWQRGNGLPSDDKQLSRIIGISDKEWGKVKPSIMPFFKEENGVILNTRMEYEIDKAKEKSIKARESAGYRWGESDMRTHSERYANASKTHMPTQCSSPSPSPKEKKSPISPLKKDHENPLAIEVLKYLNDKTGRSFSTIKGTGINQRFQDGRTIEDFKSVIDAKTEKWLNDPKMCEYLRPSTLFSEKNFENYLEESKSRPPAKKEPNYDWRLFDPLEDRL